MICIATFTKGIYTKEKKILCLPQKRNCQDLEARASTTHLLPQRRTSTEESEHQQLSRKMKWAPQQESKHVPCTPQALLSGIAGSCGSERDYRHDMWKQATIWHVSNMQPPALSLPPYCRERWLWAELGPPSVIFSFFRLPAGSRPSSLPSDMQK